MVDTLERPTTIAVRASEQRLEVAERAGVLQAALDTAFTAQARNSIEKMVCHQLAAAHNTAMHLLGTLAGMGSNPSVHAANPPAVEIARTANAAARLMEAFSSGALALHRLKTGGTQRVSVQHQQVVVAKDGDAVVLNRGDHHCARGRAERRRGVAKNGE